MKMTAQSLPHEIHYSSDGRMLLTGANEITDFYNPDSLRSVYLTFPSSNYWTQLTNNYSSETLLAADMTINGTTYNGVGVRFRGNTSYQMVGSSQKKSFAVESDFTDTTAKVMGYKKLKFNNAHEDASFMREVLYCRMAAKYTPIAKASFIHLYLNNEDWGIYPNIQDIDKTFLKEWFLSNDGALFRATVEGTGGGPGPGGGWGDGTAGMNNLGTDSLLYDNYYTLKSADIESPWQKLINACQVLSQTTTANYYTTTRNTIDIDRALWFLAVENIFTDDDSYVMKGKMDYMIYYEPESGRTFPLEYDGNSTFQSSAATSTNWGPFRNATNANYPLLSKLLAVPELRQRYLAHYRTILSEVFTTDNATAIIDDMNTQIATGVANDTKKLYSTALYTSGVQGLKTFVTSRHNYLLTNTEVAQVAPVIQKASYYNAQGAEYAAPTNNETATIKATITSAAGINKVNLYYASGIIGNFEKIAMYDDGAHGDGASGDGVYAANLPGYEAGTVVRYYVEAIANNSSLSASYLPTGAEHDVFVYTVSSVSAANGLVINELVASNATGATDESGQFADWVELYNNNSFDIDLSGYYLYDDPSDTTKWRFASGMSIPAHGYLIVWCDDDGSEGNNHTSFKLSASGEDLYLADAQLNIVDQVTFGAQTTDKGYARVPNGTGNFVIQNPTFNANNEVTGNNEIDGVKSSWIELSPVPTYDYLTVNFDVNLAGKPVLIFNSFGQVMRKEVASSKLLFDVSDLQSGVYYLSCEGISKKFIKL